MSICLAMLARNEADRIDRAIHSAAHLVDHICVLDTGSDDNTIEIARRLGADVERREWKGFGDARTYLLEWAAKQSGCDYIFVIDADMTVEGELPDHLDADAYYVMLHDRIAWRVPIITSTKLNWRFEGVTHSYLVCDGPYKGENLDTLKVIHHGRPGGRIDKFINDVGLLTMDLLKNPDNARSMYYLAQSYKDLGEFQRAAEFYGKRAAMGGWAEEQFHARLREGQCWLQLGENEKGVLALLDAWAMRPTRAEPLRELVAHYRNKERNETVAKLFEDRANQIPIPDDKLFIDRQSYAPILPASDLLPETDVPQLQLPEDDGWMLPRDFDGYYAALTRQIKPRLLVECGSGASTVVLAALQAEHGGRLVSLEHDEKFYARTRDMLATNGMEAELHLCPLGRVGAMQWYTKTPSFDGVEIDMLIVDGPPAWTAKLARYPALPMLWEKIPSNAPIILDDVGRPDEQEILRRWYARYEIGGEMLSHSKGQTALLRKSC